MNPVKSYLTLSDFRWKLIGLRWSSVENSLEYSRGVFAFAEEIAEFLEGFAGIRRIVHFGYIVRLLLLLRRAPDDSDVADSGRRRLWQLFTDTKGTLRNAGAFCGRLCRDIPAARAANHVADMCRRLRGREPLFSLLGEPTDDHTFIQIVGYGYDPPEIAPLDMTVFEGKVLEAFGRFTDGDVVFWLKHGRAPIMEDAAKTLAQAMPPTLAVRLASLMTRARLTPARAWVGQLLGALSLPPRRLVNQELPQGGYSDVTTRGQVEQILPSQFALDEWDFFRRFAERELLYFRREDPRDQTHQELVVVLDQGVRAWGDVRLVLGAALLALGKLAVLRGYPFYLATTSVDIIDPVQVDEESLGELVEGSDMSAHPGLALERVLEQSSKHDRDIVLLTHPRSLDEEDVRAASRRLCRGTRLFALTLDRHGQAELSEFRHGTPVAIRQFRVDYSLASAEPAAPPPDVHSWTGDLEPIGYPFRFGGDGTIGTWSFDFDLAGKYLLTARRLGAFHLWEVGAGLVEILPRPMWQGKMLESRRTVVLGVANGFVIAGGSVGPFSLVVHYDLVNRTCTCRPIGDTSVPPWLWDYSPEHHCLIIPHGAGRHTGFAVDLSTGEVFASNLGGPKSRAQDAWSAWERRLVSTRQLMNAYTPARSGSTPSVYVDGDTGRVTLRAGPIRWVPGARLSGGSDALDDSSPGPNVGGWPGPGNQAAPEIRTTPSATNWEFTPQADGHPMLRRHLAVAAQLGGPIVALKTMSLGGPDIRLHLIRGPEGAPVGEYLMAHRSYGYRLSADGAALARQIGRTIEISQVASSIPVVSRTEVGGFVQQLPFSLGESHLTVFPNRHAFVLEWSSGKLEYVFHDVYDRPPYPKEGTKATPQDMPSACSYDTKRWLLGARRAVMAASDRYGQVAIFDRHQKLICMFFAFRTRLAGWMPDGTRFDQVSTADEMTLLHFGRALQVASALGRKI
jgi:hypothetical protein